MKHSLSILFVVFLSFNCYGQKQIVFEQLVKFKNHKRVQTGNFKVLLPKDHKNKQIIKGHQFSTPPDGEYIDNGNHYAVWKFNSVKLIDSLIISSYIDVYRYDLIRAKKDSNNSYIEEPLYEYIQPESLIESDHKKIKNTAEELRGKSTEETVKNIYNFVVNHLDYHIFKYSRRGALKALKTGKGDCTEYSELMVALCRANEIPARMVVGYSLRRNGHVGGHNWLEVFIETIGWVPFDPTFGEDINMTFDALPTTYIYLNYYRSILRRNWNYHRFHQSYHPDVSIDYRWYDINTDDFNKVLKLYNTNNLDSANILLDTVMQRNPFDFQYSMFKGMIAARQKHFGKALEYLQYAMILASYQEEKMSVIYAFSNYYALAGNAEYAISHLERAIEMGFKNYKTIKEDEDLRSLADHPKFISILKKLKI